MGKEESSEGRVWTNAGEPEEEEWLDGGRVCSDEL